MVQREKRVAVVMLGAIAVLGGYSLIRAVVIQPRQDQIAALHQERARRDKLDNILAGEAASRERWHDLTRRTLSTHADEAHKQFFKDAADLIAASGLREPSNAKVISAGQPIRFKDRTRKGFVELPLSVTVEGDLTQLTEFLIRIYELPYLVRVNSVTIARDASEGAGGSSARGRRAAREASTKLSVAMKLSTLVLPAIPDVEHPVYDPTSATETQPVSMSLLATRDVSEYEEIAKRNLFELFRPPPPPEPERPAVADSRPPKPQEPPPRDPREGTEDLFLTATLSLNGEPVAYVSDQSRREEPPQKVRLNEQLDDGRLVLIHPSGVVVQSPMPPAGGAGGEGGTYYYYYAFKKSFRDREPLNLDDATEVARQLRLVLGPR